MSTGSKVPTSGPGKAPSAGSSRNHFRFEIHGKVQKVFFRKFTQEKATALGLYGWCQNTEEGTVVGEAVGRTKAMDMFKVWLQTKGSPKSRIDKAVFLDEREALETPFTSFDIRG